MGKVKSINSLTTVSAGSGRVKTHPKEDEKRTEVKGQMRQNKDKKTAIMAGLQHRLRRSGCCCNQECRCDLRAGSGGFTLAEMSDKYLRKESLACFCKESLT
ncbi:MAG: hypothetical protein ABSG99_01915 [Sedimentisphaerales bacterium]